MKPFAGLIRSRDHVSQIASSTRHSLLKEQTSPIRKALHQHEYYSHLKLHDNAGCPCKRDENDLQAISSVSDGPEHKREYAE